MTSPSNRPFYVSLSAVGLLILTLLGLLIFNVVDHALHHTSTTPVISSVTGVRPITASEVEVTATITSVAKQPAQVTCLVGIVRPAMPLAYQSTLTESLSPGQTKTVVVTRMLIRPKAAEVQIADVAFKCT